MPKVFTGDEIISGNVPSLEDFTRAKNSWRAWLNMDSQVDFAMFYGSAATDHMTISSDIDILIFYAGGTNNFLKKLRKFGQEHKKTSMVPIELIVYKVDHLDKGLHGLNGEFLHSIIPYAEDGTIYSSGDPLSYLNTRILPPREVGSFLATKHSNRFKQYPFIKVDVYDDVFVQYLQKLIQTPYHAIRNILFYTQRLPSKILNNRELLQLYEKEFGYNLLKNYDFLFKEQNILNSMVEERIKKGEDFDIHHYTKTANNLFEMTPYYLIFLEDLIEESRLVELMIRV